MFYKKPPNVRQVLQDEITAARCAWRETIWLDTFRSWLRALFEIVGVRPDGIAVTDTRFLMEMRGVKAVGGKIVHLIAPDEQAGLTREQRLHRLRDRAEQCGHVPHPRRLDPERETWYRGSAGQGQSGVAGLGVGVKVHEVMALLEADSWVQVRYRGSNRQYQHTPPNRGPFRWRATGTKTSRPARCEASYDRRDRGGKS